MMSVARSIRKLYQTLTAASFFVWVSTDDWLFLKFMGRKWAPKIMSNHHWASNCIWIISWQGFPLLSTSILWDDCHWESHCKVFIYNFIHHGARIMAYRALATPEPLCCGRPLVYSVLCKIRKELDPKRSPLRCNQPNSLQQRLVTVHSTGIYHKYHSREGLRIGWVRLNPSGILLSNKLWRT